MLINRRRGNWRGQVSRTIGSPSRIHYHTSPIPSLAPPLHLCHSIVTPAPHPLSLLFPNFLCPSLLLLLLCVLIPTRCAQVLLIFLLFFFRMGTLLRDLGCRSSNVPPPRPAPTDWAHCQLAANQRWSRWPSEPPGVHSSIWRTNLEMIADRSDYRSRFLLYFFTKTLKLLEVLDETLNFQTFKHSKQKTTGLSL